VGAGGGKESRKKEEEEEEGRSTPEGGVVRKGVHTNLSANLRPTLNPAASSFEYISSEAKRPSS